MIIKVGKRISIDYIVTAQARLVGSVSDVGSLRGIWESVGSKWPRFEEPPIGLVRKDIKSLQS